MEASKNVTIFKLEQYLTVEDFTIKKILNLNKIENFQ